jgi:UDP-N-acetylmuramoyl-tripeptide--D-alanyl-D-alanine ligase
MNLYFSFLKLKARVLEGRKLTRADIHRLLALKRRRELTDVRMIGVTGSGAKTTTSALVFHMLGEGQLAALSILQNTEQMIAPRLARFPRHARYGVFEISGHAPGVLDSVCELVQPDIAIITVIASDHRSNFRDSGATAREKINLALHAARRGGLVLLNADDPEVVAMLEQIPAEQVRTFGEAEAADYRALDVQQSVSGRLQFRCRFAHEEAWFDFALLGRHLLVPAMASIACAHQSGLSLAQLAARAASFVQLPGRCSLHVNPGAPTFICDTIKAPYSTLGLSFAQMDLFHDVPRKTIVIGQISDYAGAQGARYRQAYRLARQHAERVILVGRSGLTIKPLDGDELGKNLVLVEDVAALRRLISESVLAGEVILLKASYKVDRMERIALDYELQVGCWISDCTRECGCFNCDQLTPDQRIYRPSAEGTSYMIDDPDYFCDVIARDAS